LCDAFLFRGICHASHIRSIGSKWLFHSLEANVYTCTTDRLKDKWLARTAEKSGPLNHIFDNRHEDTYYNTRVLTVFEFIVFQNILYASSENKLILYIV
jgi:hypothetical protein